MPHIKVSFYPGRSQERKREIASRLQNCLSEEMNIEKSLISVQIQDVPWDRWQEEIVDRIREEELVIAPGN